jgi:hypothetical protein
VVAVAGSSFRQVAKQMRRANWGSPPRPVGFSSSDMIMNFTAVAVLPTAFLLLTAIIMFGGRKMRPLDEASHTAAGIIVSLLLICSIIWIAVAFISALTI